MLGQYSNLASPRRRAGALRVESRSRVSLRDLKHYLFCVNTENNICFTSLSVLYVIHLIKCFESFSLNLGDKKGLVK